MAHHSAENRLQKKRLTYDEPITETALYNMSKATGSANPLRSREDRTVLKGHFNCDRFVNAIDLHSSDTVEMENMTVEAHLNPALTVCILLEGHVEWSMDGEDFVLDASSGPRGFLWAYGRPVYWQRKVTAGTRIRKINISVEAGWIRQLLTQSTERMPAIESLFSDPFEVHEWPLSQRAISLTNQIINSPSGNPLLYYLRRESRALEILAEALEAIGERDVEEVNTSFDPRQLSRAEKIREFIEHSNLADLTLPLIGKALGCSVSSMQSCFKQSFGMTIMDYIRERRLIVAREAIEREGISISQAAFLAGYTSPANFSTAFKRRFGMSPSELQLT